MDYILYPLYLLNSVPSVFPQLFAFEQTAPLMMRIVLAAVFIAHGWPKLRRPAEMTGFFGSMGLKPAKFWVLVIGVIEFFGGILLLIGFLTQVAVALIAAVMIGAILLVKRRQGFIGGWEFDLALLVMALSLLVLGPGLFSVDLPF